MPHHTSYIEVNPSKMIGKPVITGTRITVELIIERLAAGESIESILQSHTSLTSESMLSAMQFAADNNKVEINIVLP